MDEQLLKALLQEHNQLSTSFDKHASIGYGVPPIVLTAVSGIFIFIDPSKRCVGIGIPILILGMLLWIGFSHSVLNHIGLRLVELELRINSHLQVPNNDGLNFYTRYIADGTRVIQGLLVHIVVTAVLGIAFVGIGAVHLWSIIDACSSPI